MPRHAWEDLPYGNGCAHHPDCFSCPFDDCVEGTIHNSQRAMCRTLKAQTQALRKQGKKVCEIMDTLGISQRTAYRYLKEMS
jgi:hypothetical protein